MSEDDWRRELHKKRVGWMTPENFQKWFHFIPTEYLEIHIHSFLVRDRSRELYYGPIDNTHPSSQIQPRIYYELGMSFRDPADVLMSKVRDETITLHERDLKEFVNDLLPLTAMARILYANDVEDTSKKYRKKK